jgi:glycosyltransferase involved in cell wall biosynthesis|tara:strand:- start:1548 stop:2840 length:1293 start_codon:yes stop_codon:yes gene_type:complete
MKNTFYISCPIDTYSGYGARSRDFVKALIESNKYDVKILSQRWGDTRKGFLNDFEEWEFLKEYVSPALTAKPDIWCQITVPNEFQKVGKYNIGLTAGIETTACAAPWIEGCNRMDLILTSSEHSKRVFEGTKYESKDQQTGKTQEVKLTTPVEVLFEGVDLNVYKSVKEFKNKELYNKINNIPEKFAYLFVGHWLQGELGQDRKNVGLLVKAFYEVFKGKSNAPALILKTSIGKGSHMDRREIQKRINSIKKSVPGEKLPHIYLLHGDLSNSEVNELYNHPKIKSNVSATKGEGFGRPLLEFALTGKPTIATGWSGHVDFLDGKLTPLMGGKLNPIHASAQQKDMLIEGSQWFDVDHGHLGHFLMDVKKNYKKWTPKSKTLANRLKKKFSFNAMKELLIKILDDKVDIPTQVKLNIPKLDGMTLPTMKKI